MDGGLVSGGGSMTIGGSLYGRLTMGHGDLPRCFRGIMPGGYERWGGFVFSSGGRVVFGAVGRFGWVFSQRRFAPIVAPGRGGGCDRIMLTQGCVFRCRALRRTEDDGKGPQDNYRYGYPADDARCRKFPEFESFGVFFHDGSVFDIVPAGGNFSAGAGIIGAF
jgi:hypothetical protein